MEETRFPNSFPVDVNSASQTELEGAGLSAELAQAVLDYRAENGPFGSVEQLLDVPGVDRSDLEVLGDRISVAALEGSELDADVSGMVSDKPDAVQPADDAELDLADDAIYESTDEDSESLEEAGLTESAADAESDGVAPAEPAENVVEDVVADTENGNELAVPPEPEPSTGEQPESVSSAGDIPAEPAATAELPDVSADATDESDIDDVAASRGVAPGPSPVDKEASLEERAEPPTLEDDLDTVTEEEMPESAALESADQCTAGADDAASTGTAQEEEGPDLVASATTVEAPGRQPGVEATATAAPRERSRWHDIGMIALGGLLGVLATLVILGVVGGTLNYAPRRLVDAINDNLAVMQANQETTWSETQALGARADALDRRLSALEGLEDRVVELESGSAEIETRLADTAVRLGRLDTQLAELSQSQALKFNEIDGRIGTQERQISVLTDAVASTRETLQAIQDQVARYEAFFDALRTLLNEMQEPAAADTGA